MCRPCVAPEVAATVALVIVLPGAAPLVLLTVALVIVLPGGPAMGRWPSPVPRIDSAKICTSVAVSVPSALGAAVVPRKVPCVMRSSEDAERAVVRRRPAWRHGQA